MPRDLNFYSAEQASVVAVCVSPGGVPKTRVDRASVTREGLAGDGHDHEKHSRPDRAVCIQDVELLYELKRSGYPVEPGIIGENLTVRRLNVQKLRPGTTLAFRGGPWLELTEPRKPCFVLDKIHPDLKDVLVDRCGYMAKVLRPGEVYVGQEISVWETNGDDERGCR